MSDDWISVDEEKYAEYKSVAVPVIGWTGLFLLMWLFSAATVYENGSVTNLEAAGLGLVLLFLLVFAIGGGAAVLLGLYKLRTIPIIAVGWLLIDFPKKVRRWLGRG